MDIDLMNGERVDLIDGALYIIHARQGGWRLDGIVAFDLDKSQKADPFPEVLAFRSSDGDSDLLVPIDDIRSLDRWPADPSVIQRARDWAANEGPRVPAVMSDVEVVERYHYHAEKMSQS